MSDNISQVLQEYSAAAQYYWPTVSDMDDQLQSIIDDATRTCAPNGRRKLLFYRS